MNLDQVQIEHLLRLAYLEGISDCMLDKIEPKSFNILMSYREKMEKMKDGK